MTSLPDLGALSDPELKELIRELTEQEREVSYRRRLLHGRIDTLRAELVTRLRRQGLESDGVLGSADIDRLNAILEKKTASMARDA